MTNIPIEGLSLPTEKPHHESPGDWKEYFSFSTDHKVIGIQYLVTSFFFFLSRRYLCDGDTGRTNYTRIRFSRSHRL